MLKLDRIVHACPISASSSLNTLGRASQSIVRERMYSRTEGTLVCEAHRHKVCLGLSASFPTTSYEAWCTKSSASSLARTGHHKVVVHRNLKDLEF